MPVCVSVCETVYFILAFKGKQSAWEQYTRQTTRRVVSEIFGMVDLFLFKGKLCTILERFVSPS